MEETFLNAAFNSRVEEMKDILRNNPSLNVNWKNEESYARTALFVSCWNGCYSVVSILLAHPDINPNLKEMDGWTPFMTACLSGRTSCVRLLLQDHRVMVNEPNDKLETPLQRAAYFGRHDVIKLWIASGRRWIWGNQGMLTRRMPLGRQSRAAGQKW